MLAALSGTLVGRILCVASGIYLFILFARVIWTWFPIPFSGPLRTVHTVLVDLTDPVLKPLRGIIPPIQTGGVALDLSPILAFVILGVLRQALC